MGSFLPASGTGETLLMVRVAEGRHHLALHVQSTGGAALSKVLLVAFCAVVVLLAGKEAPLR